MITLIHRLPNGTAVGAWRFQNNYPVSHYTDAIRQAYGRAVVGNRAVNQASWDHLVETLPYSASPLARWSVKELPDDALLSTALSEAPSEQKAAES